MTQLKDGGRQPSNREERPLSASTVIARWQGNGWDEPCKSRGLRTVLWAAGGEIPPADPAAPCHAPFCRPDHAKCFEPFMRKARHSDAGRRRTLLKNKPFSRKEA